MKRSDRSEEHTSELQSRGLISYAVFCLKKKTLQPNAPPDPQHSSARPGTLTRELSDGVDRTVDTGQCALRYRQYGCAYGPFFFLMNGHPPRSTPFPSRSLFR